MDVMKLYSENVWVNMKNRKCVVYMYLYFMNYINIYICILYYSGDG